MGIVAIDHVQIAIPAGGEAAARAFYVGTLGLIELVKPIALIGRGGCWFQSGDRQLHLGVDPVFLRATKAHVAFATDDLDSLRAQIEAAGWSVRDDVPLDDRRRFFTEDPFGNRLELLERSHVA